MKPMPTYEVDRLSPAELGDRCLEEELNLAPRMSLPATACELGVYVEQLLSSAEQEVCDHATD